MFFYKYAYIDCNKNRIKNEEKVWGLKKKSEKVKIQNPERVLKGVKTTVQLLQQQELLHS